jgi:hypothetical protein
MVLTSHRDLDDSSPTLSSLNMNMIIHSLPFADQCHIFWNMMASLMRGGMQARVAYSGSNLTHLASVTSATGEETSDSMVSAKVLSPEHIRTAPLLNAECLMLLLLGILYQLLVHLKPAYARDCFVLTGNRSVV